MPKISKKGGRMEKRPMVALPPDLHKALRHYATDHDVQMQSVVAEALRQYLEQQQKGGKASKK
jgi:predicted transcriptional regulator